MIMNQLRRHLRVGRACLAQAVRRDLQFRAQVWTTLLIGFVEVATALLPIWLLTRSTDGIRGWSAGGMIMISGLCQLVMALLGTFVAPNAAKFTAYVKDGELDTMLIRPLSGQWFTATRWSRPAELWGCIPGAALLVVGAITTQEAPTPLAAATGIGWFILGTVLVGLLWLNLGYLAFWFTSVSPVGELMSTLLGIGRYPVAFFPSAIRVIMLFVLPVGVATTVPAQLLTSSGTAEPAIVSAGIVAALPATIILTRLHWLVAVRRYASASS